MKLKKQKELERLEKDLKEEESKKVVLEKKEEEDENKLLEQFLKELEK